MGDVARTLGGIHDDRTRSRSATGAESLQIMTGYLEPVLIQVQARVGDLRQFVQITMRVLADGHS